MTLLASLFPANDRPQLLSMTVSRALLFPFSEFLSLEHAKCLCHFWEFNKVHYGEETGNNTQEHKSAVFTWMLQAVSHDRKWNVWKSTGWIRSVLVTWWAFYRLCSHVTWCLPGSSCSTSLEWLLPGGLPFKVAFWCGRTLGYVPKDIKDSVPLRMEQEEGFRSVTRY